MSIAFIVNNFPLLSETFILNQITGLIDKGHNIEIYSLNESKENKIHPDVLKYRLGENTIYATFPIKKIPRIIRGLKVVLINIRKYPKIILKSLNYFKYGKDAINFVLLCQIEPFLGKEYDIIHCHFGPNGNFASVLKEIGVIHGKIITTFHGYDMRMLEENGEYIFRNLIKTGDAYISISNYNKSILVDSGFSREKIYCLNNPINKAFFKNKGFKHNNSEFKIVTVARLVEEKALHIAIEAIRKCITKFNLNNIKYIIAGDGPLKDYLIDLIYSYGLVNNIELIGAINQVQVYNLISKADLFLLSSKHEALPVAIMEAMASGLPVVTTDVGGISEIVIDGETGYLVQSGDSKEMAYKIKTLLTNPSIRKKIGHASSEYARKQFNLEKHLNKLIRIYDQVL